jgi:hypothetical protein
MGIIVTVIIIAAIFAIASKLGAKKTKDQEAYANYLQREHGVYTERPDNRYAHMMNAGR